MIDTWEGCYDDGWKGEITPEAFCHPAKFSRGLIRRIYQHMDDEGWLPENGIILDPFGGIALGGLDACLHGLTWVGIELESKFCALAEQNIALWNKRYAGKMPKWGNARIINGDSRNLAAILQGEAGASVSSPPYADTINQHGEGPQGAGDRHGHISPTENAAKNIGIGYGNSPGQLSAMKSGDFQAAVSSPPYEGSMHGNNIDPEEVALRKTEHSTVGGSWLTEGRKRAYATMMSGYNPDNTNNLGSTSGSDFWTASRLIVDQVYSVLAPGAHAIWMVKAFVKNKALVDFPGQWRQMCEAAGFETVHVHHAMLVKDKGTQINLQGNSHTKTIERKSFFRRLAENKGSPRIDYEVVLCMVKP